MQNLICEYVDLCIYLILNTSKKFINKYIQIKLSVTFYHVCNVFRILDKYLYQCKSNKRAKEKITLISLNVKNVVYLRSPLFIKFQVTSYYYLLTQKHIQDMIRCLKFNQVMRCVPVEGIVRHQMLPWNCSNYVISKDTSQL